MPSNNIPRVILKHLQDIEPSGTFNGSLPRIQSSSGRVYYAKFGLSKDREQWEGEAESLKSMHQAAPGIAPKPFAFGVVDEEGNEVDASDHSGRPFFLSEYSDFSSLTNDAAIRLGKRMATEMHKYESTQGFGFGVPTYCGATRFQNGWYKTWAECFDSMIGQMLGHLEQQGRFARLRSKGKELRERYVFLHFGFGRL